MIQSSRIDAPLRDAVETGKVPGVVAMAANADGIVYEGAFGHRLLGGAQPMTLDTVFSIASMTKAITGAAAMQLVEQGKLTLDEPLGRFAPQLAEPQVLEGFDASGAPRLRPACRPITLRHLMTHTAGFGYDVWNEDLRRYAEVTGKPGARTGRLAGLEAPLVFDPGERWEYGINIDWIGRIVEAISGEDLESYFRAHLFGPLGMRDTGFAPTDAQAARGAGMHVRAPDGSLTGAPYQKPSFPEFYPGGGGLFSTGPDYLRFLQALMHGGSLDGARVLKPETVALMGENQMGALNVLPMRTADPAASNHVELFPGMTKKWGLSFLINTEDAPTGRSAGSLCWAGLRNTYYWLDPKKRVAGVLLTQILPFADPTVLGLLDAFEGEVYKALA
jgi:CubicO group peptidase (beta-lactamase class C family)